jgi:hypothetical protein
METGSEHLSDESIEEFCYAGRTRKAEWLTSSNQHLETCELCSDRLSMFLRCLAEHSAWPASTTLTPGL